MKQSTLDAFLRLRQNQFAHYSIVSLDPPIFHVQPNLDPQGDFIAGYQVLFDALRGRKAYCLFRITSALTPRLFDWIEQIEGRCREQYPEVELIHLCNAPGEAERFRARGARAIFCSSNCFVDESIFLPLPSVEKRFTAVYNARLIQLKRHFLAREVAGLALIHYPVPGDDQAYVQQVREQLPGAHFFNDAADGSYRQLFPPEVSRCLNACRVGLCLSELEGPMSASVEYLLCGRPVVATPSSGGREVFFEDSFVVTVPPEPGAVRQAVDELAARALPPELIRRSALQKVQEHRRAFMALVQDIYDQHGIQRRFADEWDRVFHHRMLGYQSHFKTIALLHAADAARQAS